MIDLNTHHMNFVDDDGMFKAFKSHQKKILIDLDEHGYSLVNYIINDIEHGEYSAAIAQD